MEGLNVVWMKANEEVLLMLKNITNDMILMCMQSD